MTSQVVKNQYYFTSHLESKLYNQDEVRELLKNLHSRKLIKSPFL